MAYGSARCCSLTSYMREGIARRRFGCDVSHVGVGPPTWSIRPGRIRLSQPYPPPIVACMLDRLLAHILWNRDWLCACISDEISPPKSSASSSLTSRHDYILATSRLHPRHDLHHEIHGQTDMENSMESIYQDQFLLKVINQLIHQGRGGWQQLSGMRHVV
jgi:hypothetical protein